MAAMYRLKFSTVCLPQINNGLEQNKTDPLNKQTNKNKARLLSNVKNLSDQILIIGTWLQ